MISRSPSERNADANLPHVGVIGEELIDSDRFIPCYLDPDPTRADRKVIDYPDHRADVPIEDLVHTAPVGTRKRHGGAPPADGTSTLLIHEPQKESGLFQIQLDEGAVDSHVFERSDNLRGRLIRRSPSSPKSVWSLARRTKPEPPVFIGLSLGSVQTNRRIR